jgi:hypothetical protein
MGNVVSDVIKSVDKADEKEARAKEQLEMLMKLADARLDTFEGKLKQMFLDRECKYFWDFSLLSIDDLLAAAKMSVPGKRALRFERSVRVDTGAEVIIISLHC